MTRFTLTKTRFTEGLWQGVLSTPDRSATPDIRVTLNDAPVGDVMVSEMPADISGATSGAASGAGETGPHWLVQIPVPATAIGDGVQTVLITDGAADTVLSSFTLIAGEALGDDLRAEVELLRAELDMLKRAFRRHCLETT